MLRRTLFEALHGLAHPGVKASVTLIPSRFSWRGLAKDVRVWVQSCVACQRAKVHKHTKAPISTRSPPDAHFSHVHVDLVGSLPLSLSQRYLLTYVDRYTRWPVAIPIPDITAETVVNAFLLVWAAVACERPLTTQQRTA